MMAFSGGELAIILIVLLLVWGAAVLPPLAERLASRCFPRRGKGG